VVETNGARQKSNQNLKANSSINKSSRRLEEN
jgi:hypothetical protein